MNMSRRTALVGAAFGLAALPGLSAAAATAGGDVQGAKKRATLILSPHQ